ncbi:MAG: hypothetical protein ACTSRP_20005 [Candidatus Helarchaeota archaeon]
MKTKILLIILFFMAFFPYFISNTLASEDYVGVKEKDVYTWTITADEDVYEDYTKDSSRWEPQSDLQASDDSYEDNDDFYNAITLTEGEYPNLNVTYDDSDWFKIFVEKDDFIDIIVTSNSYYFDDLELFLYDAGKNELDYSYPKNDIARVNACASYTGYYYIQIELWCYDPVIYDLRINILNECPYADFYNSKIWKWEAIKIEIKEIKDKVKLYNIHYVPVEMEMYVSEIYPTEDWLDTPYTMFYIYDSRDRDFYLYFLMGLDYLFYFYDEFNYFMTIPLISAKNTDWDGLLKDIVNDINDLDNINASGEKVFFDYHLKLDYKDKKIDNIEIIFRYNDNGILEYGEILYGGLQLGKVEMVGLNTYTFYGIIAAAIGIPAIIGIIFLIKKIKG